MGQSLKTVGAPIESQTGCLWSGFLQAKPCVIWERISQSRQRDVYSHASVSQISQDLGGVSLQYL